MKKILLVCFLSLFIGCLGSEEEDLQVKLEYNHKEDVRQYRGGRRPVLVAKHEIDVRSFQEKYIYDKTVLDENLTGTVMVPVEVDLEVQYKNYSFEEPELYYESGVSEPFKVLFNSSLSSPEVVSSKAFAIVNLVKGLYSNAVKLNFLNGKINLSIVSSFIFILIILFVSG